MQTKFWWTFWSLLSHIWKLQPRKVKSSMKSDVQWSKSSQTFASWTLLFLKVVAGRNPSFEQKKNKVRICQTHKCIKYIKNSALVKPVTEPYAPLWVSGVESHCKECWSSTFCSSPSYQTSQTQSAWTTVPHWKCTSSLKTEKWSMINHYWNDVVSSGCSTLEKNMVL